MRRIDTRRQLVELARELGVRRDWHEPDEQNLTARFAGTDQDFDNAGFWGGVDYGTPDRPRQEMHIILVRTDTDPEEDPEGLGVPVAAVNLATLFAWATGYESEDGGAR